VAANSDTKLSPLTLVCSALASSWLTGLVAASGPNTGLLCIE
jgi:hypothetical protein